MNSVPWDFIFIPSLVVVILTVVFLYHFYNWLFFYHFIPQYFLFCSNSCNIFFSFIFFNYFFQFHSWISHWFIVWIIIFFDVKISVSSPNNKCEILTRVDISLFLPFCFKLFFSQIHHSTFIYWRFGSFIIFLICFLWR